MSENTNNNNNTWKCGAQTIPEPKEIKISMEEIDDLMIKKVEKDD